MFARSPPTPIRAEHITTRSLGGLAVPDATMARRLLDHFLLILRFCCLAWTNNGDTILEGRLIRRMVENLEKWSAAEIGRLIAKGDLDPVEVAELFLDRIERDRDNPSFILVTRERALMEAAASRTRHRAGRAAGPLDGVPIAWKDLVDMAGERTTAGSALYADSAPKENDAPIVSNLAAAGMVALGKTNLTE